MTSIEHIRNFLAQPRFAMIGVSRRPKDFSRDLYREFRDRGYDAIPVNPEADEIDGQACFHRLQDVNPPVENVLLMTSPAVTDRVVRDCATSGIKRVWMYRAGGRGAVTAGAVDFCESNGISVIPGECPFMFLEGGAWYHRLHGLVRKMTGSYPS
jgi:predicted CoA-binding protein